MGLLYGWGRGRADLTAGDPDLKTSKGTVQLRPDDAAVAPGRGPRADPCRFGRLKLLGHTPRQLPIVGHSAARAAALVIAAAVVHRLAEPELNA